MPKKYTFLKRWWAAPLALLAYILSSVFLLIGRTQLASVVAVAAYTLLGLTIAIFILNRARRAMPSTISGSIYVGIYSVLIAIAAVTIFVGGRTEFPAASPSQKSAETSKEVAPALEPASSEDVVRFTSTLNLAKRMGSSVGSPPLFRAGVENPLDSSVEFKPPQGGMYYLAVQMADEPFIAESQSSGEYLEVVREDYAVGQTLTVPKDITTLGGVRVKLEARSIVNSQPAGTPPDAPLTAKLYQLSGPGDRKLIDAYELPTEQAGLNDQWKYATFPFEVNLASGSNQTFLVEFTSPSTTNGWALSRVANGFGGIDDHYPGGELLINGSPPEYGPAADLTFDILARSEQSDKPELFVDDIELQLSRAPGEDNWFISQPVDLSEEIHLLIIKSDNPHISFYRFVFFQELSSLEEGEITDSSPEQTDVESDEGVSKDTGDSDEDLELQSPEATPTDEDESIEE